MIFSAGLAALASSMRRKRIGCANAVLLPVMNAYARFNERQADLYAWKSLGSVRPFCSAMEKLATQNLSEREPSRWVEILFHSHPAIGRRVKAALAWENSQR